MESRKSHKYNLYSLLYKLKNEDTGAIGDFCREIYQDQKYPGEKSDTKQIQYLRQWIYFNPHRKEAFQQIMFIYFNQ